MVNSSSWAARYTKQLEASILPNAVAFSVAPRLAAHFASAKGFQFADLDALQDGVCPVIDVEPQAAEFLFGLLDLKRASGCFLGLHNERLQVFAQPPHDVEPAVAVGKAICHSGLALISRDVEPRRPTLHQFLFQFFLHVCSPQLARVQHTRLRG